MNEIKGLKFERDRDIHQQTFVHTNNFWRKYLEEIREIKQNCAEAEDFDACVCVIFQRCYKFHF